MENRALNNLRVAVIGSGNVATHLAAGLAAAGCEIVCVCSPTIAHARRLAGRFAGCSAVDSLASIPADADLYLISTVDSAVAGIAAGMPRVAGLVAHTLGSVPLASLAPASAMTAVIYPLQTFSREVAVRLDDIPFFTEASTDEALAFADRIAGLLSPKVYHADSAHRKILHIAGVLSCNFANYLWDRTSDLLDRAGYSFDVVRPLIETTLRKAVEVGPHAAQTETRHAGRPRRHRQPYREPRFLDSRNLPHNDRSHNRLTQKAMSKINYDLSKIRGIAFDVDGVLSPSTIPLGEDGVPRRMVNIKDGYALQLAARKGLKLAIISGAKSEAVEARFRALGITDIYMKAADKLPCLNDWLDKNGLSPDEVAASPATTFPTSASCGMSDSALPRATPTNLSNRLPAMSPSPTAVMA